MRGRQKTRTRTWQNLSMVRATTLTENRKQTVNVDQVGKASDGGLLDYFL